MLDRGEASAGRPDDACESESKLTQKQLDSIFSEDDPGRHFELFASSLGWPDVDSMSTPTRITTEYDFFNVVFCREQNFSAEQTLLFREIARSVFEWAIVRGELSVDEAFQAFTDRVLSLAVMGDDSGPSARGSDPLDSEEGACNHEKTRATAERAGRVVPKPPKAVAPLSVRDEPVRKGPGLSEGEHEPGGDVGDTAAKVTVGATRRTSADAVFSVGDIAIITDFVARDLYRNFALYRMCFTKQGTYCRELRNVQVETPPAPPPLREV